MIDSFYLTLKKHEKEFKGNSSKAYLKFQLWYELFKKIKKENLKNVNILGMVFTLKLIVYTGIIESLNTGSGNRAKFFNFFNKLSEYEKLLIMLAIQRGGSTDKINKREKKLVLAYLNDDKILFNREFENTIGKKDIREQIDLYSLRSKIVHSGDYVSAMVSFSTWPQAKAAIITKIFPYRSFDMKLRIDEDIIKLDELFIRGFCRLHKIDLPSVKARVKKYILTKGYPFLSKELYEKFKIKFG